MQKNETIQAPVVADPAPLGLTGLAMVTLVAASQKLGWTTGLSMAIPWAIFLGGIAQLMACVYDFKNNINLKDELVSHFEYIVQMDKNIEDINSIEENGN